MNADTRAGESLMTRWIEANPRKPWEAEARILGTGIPVWALIGYLPAVDDDYEQVAHDYGLPLEAVRAAVAYYHTHRAAIDARLAANAAYAP